MGKITKEFRNNAGVFAIVGAGIAAIGALLYAGNQPKVAFEAAAEKYDAFMICVPTRTPDANANLVVHVPIEAMLQDQDKQLIKEKLQDIVHSFSADEYSRNVPALEARAGATMLGLTRELDAPIQVRRGPLTSVCP